MTPTTWRVRLRAVLSLTERALLRFDAFVAACWDTRPLAHHLLNGAAWLGRTWRRHLSAARTRTHGPGRGVIAVVITRPRTERDRT